MPDDEDGEFLGYAVSGVIGGALSDILKGIISGMIVEILSYLSIEVERINDRILVTLFNFFINFYFDVVLYYQGNQIYQGRRTNVKNIGWRDPCKCPYFTTTESE